MTQQLEKNGTAIDDLIGTRSEFQIAILSLGIVQALRHHRMTIDQAWDALFNVKNLLLLHEKKADKRLLKMFEWALELPNVEPLGKSALDESYSAIERLADSVLIARFQKRNSPGKNGDHKKKQKMSAPPRKKKQPA